MITASTSVFGGLILAFIFSLLYKNKKTRIPAEIDRVRTGGFLAHIRAFGCRLGTRVDDIRNGYNKFNKNGKPFVIQDSTFIPQVVIPPQYLGWLKEQPEKALSAETVRLEQLGLRYLVPSSDPEMVHLLTDVVCRYLTRNFQRVQERLYEELHMSTDEIMGLEATEWRQICLHEAMETILRRMISCVLIGLPWCRDEECLKSWTGFLHCMAIAGTILGAVTPWFLRPLLGLLLKPPVGYMRRRSLRYLTPIFTERWKKIEKHEKSSLTTRELPDDFVTWCIQEVRNGAAEVTMLDLLSADPTIGYWEKLVEEATTAFRTDEDWIHAGTVSKLAYTDSAIRESLRRNPFSIRNVTREVIGKDGLTLPSGTRLPQGTWITTALANIHHDARFYSNPTEYQPFRFVARDAFHTEGKEGSEKVLQPSEAILTSTIDERLLTFGYGRRACPGRWFASHILKMLIAYITINYDIQPLTGPPKKVKFADFTVPSPSIKIIVRRKNLAYLRQRER
uniref:Cytochrome P450 monooxygenase nodZ n=1 Tax=Hypoxylon pulicicidum TaxID=1243767 RepID=NODZ_HYPPI|nr:RecName: Full=Cytochrome P450 monooxygenase nodZ; AltName: Full=Nodulisporic acid biosynthesis cluster protein Z [Hypoxylon pulicicidum]AUM60058.1 cytochrome P450 oxygenase [Hypoxylon pulicicidum]